MKPRACLRLLIPGVCCLGWLISSAEVARTVNNGQVNGTIILGLTTDGPDPFGMWFPFPHDAATSELVLNPSGPDRGDERPDVFWRPNGDPVAVWAYAAGADFDIAFSEWKNNAWTATEFLTSSIAEERDPRVVVDYDGTVHVVWWVSGPTGEKVYLMTRPAGTESWDAPRLVTNGSARGRRPSVVVLGNIKVAYERDSAASGMAQDVVVATEINGGGFSTAVVASTPRTEALDPIVHKHGHDLWVDWMHGSNEFAAAQLVGAGWSEPLTEPWTDTSWVGVETMRWVLRSRVLAD